MADASKAEKKPLIPTGIHTEFGELLDDPDFVQNDDTDYTWTPGFSESRIARDKALAEVAAGRLPKNKVPTLAGNVRLVRRTVQSGAPDQIKTMRAANKGYRILTKDDIGPGKLVTSLPSAAVVLADGTITKGDCVYMFCDAQQAARNSFEKQRKTQARLSAAQSRAQDAGVGYSSKPGEALESFPSTRLIEK